MLLYEDTVREEWVDFNGHMRDAYYGLVFSYAIDDMMDKIGMGEGYRSRTRGTLYTAEDHRFYVSEVHCGSKLEVRTFFLDVDRKRLHLHQRMLSGGSVRAVCESMQLHVTQSEPPKSTDMPEPVQKLAERMKDADAAHADLLPRAGRLAIRRKT